MDEMTTQFEGVVLFLGAMLAVMSLVLALLAGWAGRRRLRRGQWRRALWITNALIVLNAATVGAAMLRTTGTADTYWPWVWVLVSAPLLVGYALGTSLGLLGKGPSLRA